MSISVFPSTATQPSPEAKWETGVRQQRCQALARPLAGPEPLGKLPRTPENWTQERDSTALLSPLGQDAALLLLGLRASDGNGLPGLLRRSKPMVGAWPP